MRTSTCIKLMHKVCTENESQINKPRHVFTSTENVSDDADKRCAMSFRCADLLNMFRNTFNRAPKCAFCELGTFCVLNRFRVNVGSRHPLRIKRQEGRSETLQHFYPNHRSCPRIAYCPRRFALRTGALRATEHFPPGVAA